MQKRLKLLPSLKERKRYIVYEALGKQNDEDIKTFIKNSIISYIGELGVARAGIQFLKDNIIRVDHKYVDKIKSAMILNKNYTLRSKYVSGTLKKARQKGRE